jgi:hypothetical protein
MILAAFLVSCGGQIRPHVPGAGYSDRDAYRLGFSDGARDESVPLPYNPRIDEPHRVPSAHRNDYLRGYSEGFRDPHKFRPLGSK